MHTRCFRTFIQLVVDTLSLHILWLCLVKLVEECDRAITIATLHTCTHDCPRVADINI